MTGASRWSELDPFSINWLLHNDHSSVQGSEALASNVNSQGIPYTGENDLETAQDNTHTTLTLQYGFTNNVDSVNFDLAGPLGAFKSPTVDWRTAPHMVFSQTYLHP